MGGCDQLLLFIHIYNLSLLVQIKIFSNETLKILLHYCFMDAYGLFALRATCQFNGKESYQKDWLLKKCVLPARRYRMYSSTSKSDSSRTKYCTFCLNESDLLSQNRKLSCSLLATTNEVNLVWNLGHGVSLATRRRMNSSNMESAIPEPFLGISRQQILSALNVWAHETQKANWLRSTDCRQAKDHINGFNLTKLNWLKSKSRRTLSLLTGILTDHCT